MFPSDVDYNTKVTLETEAMPILDDPPFHILLMGDWSGKESHAGESDKSDLIPIEIDRDNFDDILKKMNVRLDLDFQGNVENVLSIGFNELEDFHPDRILQRLPLFAKLRDVRQRLLNANTFNAAAIEVRSWLTKTESKEEVGVKSRNIEIKESEALPNDLLSEILEQSDEKIFDSQNRYNKSSELSDFVKEIVKPYLLETDTAEQSNLLLIVDEVISDLMRKILHYPQFQALESAWRGALFVVRQVKTNNNLKIYLLDISKNQLAFNLKSVNDLTDSNLYQLFISNNDSWSVICGNYTFSLNIDDAATLIRIAKIASDVNIPFISHIKPEMFGVKTFEETQNSDKLEVTKDSTEGKLWTTLRSIPEAEYLGLTMPRILMRLPYGEKTDPTETFCFEEFTEIIQHEKYLWANPVFISALLLAQTFYEYGWNISENFLQDVEGLPVHLYRDGDENKAKPCAEILMTQSKCEKILEQGLIPLISFRDTDRIRIGNLQCIAYPLTSLKGKWN